MAAAFELTRPELAGRYAVSVYQMGWRLGGKGASGRGEHGRIEEHGLHLWMGYYENAFRLMRECYAEQNRASGGWRFEDAFSPAPLNGAMDWSPNAGWIPWKVEFPWMRGVPGDPNPPRFSIPDYLGHGARLLRTLLSTLSTEAGGQASAGDILGELLRGRAPSEQDLAGVIKRFTKFGALAGLGALIEALGWLEIVLGALPRFPQSLVVRLADVVTELSRGELRKLSESSDEVRRLWEVAELILAAIRGSIRFRLAFDPRGFDAIDDYDCREWLKLNGASDGAINSAFIRALYDLAFAYAGGDANRPAIAAGSAMRGAFRAFFSYRGSFFWRMNAGMGDVVFAPFYETLRRRGVRFEFFHKLTRLVLAPPDAASPHVTALEFDVQARTLNGGPYAPLQEVAGLSCWPAKPLFDQLEGGAALAASGIDFEAQGDRRAAARKTLEVGKDFDLVVLAVGLGVVHAVCGELVERDSRWREMLRHVRSVPTQALQLWLDVDRRELGLGAHAVNLSGFVEPFDTMADMTHVVEREHWRVAPKALAYFCNVLEDRSPEQSDYDSPAFVNEAKARVFANSVEFLKRHAHHLWPRARSVNGEFAWDTLAVRESDGSPGAAPQGAERLRSQYWSANVRMSDRYTQALPGSTKYRISPLDRSYDNLTIAGDWTNCSLNMGCVEAAVMSGRLAAHALSGSPALKDIVGFDHP
jgi:uncharacterized protein with NAD-binding domain and iron-sulfur cluster